MNSKDNFDVVKIRWYILFIYSIYASFQACIFNTWGPIAQSLKTGFNWTDEDIAWMGNVKIVAGGLTVPVTYPIVQKLGLRNTVVWSGVASLSVSTALRCVSMDAEILKITAFICAACNGWTSIMIEGTLTLLVVTWFPAGERTTATGIIVATQMLGLVPPSILFPILVDDPGKRSSYDSPLVLFQSKLRDPGIVTPTIKFPILAKDIQAERKKILPGLRLIFTDWGNMASGLAFACITVPLMWIAVVNQNLEPLGLDQVETGYISTSIIGVSFMFNLINSRLADIFYGNLKLVICMSLLASCCMSTWLALLCLEVLPANKPSVFISAIGSMVFIRGVIGLFYELLMEIHFPVPESLVTLAWGQLGRIFAAIFLGMFSVLPGVSWMNYFLVGFTLIPLLLLLSITMEYNRSNMDNIEHSIKPKYTNKCNEFIYAYDTS